MDGLSEGLNIVAVQFRKAGKLYDFDSGDTRLKVGDFVIVDTDRGHSLAKVAKLRYGLPRSDDRALKSIVRKASEHELNKKSRISESEVTKFTKDAAERLKLKMRVLKSEVQFGGNKVIVYFTAPGRVDFRELVKELASGLKTRVELTQVGARDETKLLGGIGICGREFCCSTFLREFLPVSIKMAKNQNLALNPSKVSGGCGRLLCCLTYEDEVYTELRQKLPPRGARLRLLEKGVEGIVVRCDILNQLVLVKTDQGTMLLPLKEVEVIDGKASGRQADAYDDEESQLEAEEWAEGIDLKFLDGDDGDNLSSLSGAVKNSPATQQAVGHHMKGKDKEGRQDKNSNHKPNGKQRFSKKGRNKNRNHKNRQNDNQNKKDGKQ
ncbi:MAG: regulatory iron-sulfur-containing complex subunit RicT [Bdellovibrionota bacterium]